MSDSFNRAEHYRGLAEAYRRLAATECSTQIRERYRRMAGYYNSLGEVEEQSTQARAKKDGISDPAKH